MNTPLYRIFEERGLKAAKVCRTSGLKYNTVRQHLAGIRRITAEQALRYEEELGIPRSELRPDLWPPDEVKEAMSAPEA